ncbi:MAG: CvpA family protein [Clostridiales bacterium]|nr:CvpA family protein [Clostridiales bacterium]
MGLNWLDIAIIIVIIITCIDGMNKGFVYSCFNIIGVFISLFIAKIFTPLVSKFVMDSTPIYNSLKGLFEKRVGSLNKASLSLLQLLNIKDAAIGETLTIIFINIACFICLFLISTIILNIFRDSLRKLIKMTPIKYIDKLGGVAIGIIKAGVLIFVFFAVITPLLGLLPQSNELVIAIGTSKLAKYFYMYNFIIPWMQKIIYL